jgi:hypothetical protein
MRKEGATGRYARIEIDLGVASSDGLLELSGDYIGVVSITGDGTAKIRLDHRHAQQINLREVQEISSPFGKMYLECDGAGGLLTLYIGGALTARLKPIQSKVSIRTVAGTDVDLVEDKRFLAHSPEVLIIKVGADFAADVISAASLKVKWAIIYNDLQCYYGVADVSPTNGLPLSAESYTTVEYIDLNKLYVVGDGVSTRPQLNIIYVEEK